MSALPPNPQKKCLTLNLQGAKNLQYSTRLLTGGFLIALQEAGRGLNLPGEERKDLVLPENVIAKEIALKGNANLKRSYIYWKDSRAGNDRCSMAMLVDLPIADLLECKLFSAQKTNLRPLLVAKFAKKTRSSDVILGVFHAPASNEDFATETLEGQIAALQDYDKNTPYILGGDFNADATLGTALSSEARPNEATHQNGRSLDGFRYRGFAVAESASVQAGIGSDHWPVQASFSI